MKANAIIPHSKNELCMMLMPKTGSVLSIKGRRAQCMAQATEVAIPMASQFNFIFIFDCRQR